MVWVGLGVIAAVCLYAWPSFTAFRRRVEPRWIILVVNVLFGWTLLAWLAMLIWAYQAGRVPEAPPTDGA